MDIREYLKDNILLFDGAMGTLWMQQNRDADHSCEMANLLRPESVLSIHKAYLDAGAKAIKTNTFSVNPASMNGDRQLMKNCIEAGWKLANEAAKDRDVTVFADIGPISKGPEEEVWQQYKAVIDAFADLGAKNYLFETNSSAQCLERAAGYIKDRIPEAFVMTSFAVLPDGYTREGVGGSELIEQMAGCKKVDAVGFNCVAGAYHMKKLVSQLNIGGLIFSTMPNAGYPTVVGNRTVYNGDPGYFAMQMAELGALGVKILGGCCGTNPEHIARLSEAIAQGGAEMSELEETVAAPVKKDQNRLWKKLEEGKRVFAVELDPPKTAELGKFMSAAWQLKAAGVDSITLADCPIGRTRMDSSLLACKIKRELDIDPLPHMTCRDRNLNATKALLLGLSVEGVDNVLIVTGDPIPTAERDEVKSVFNFNSRKLAAFITSLNNAELERPFRIFGALNINAANFDVELSRAKQKIQSGISAFLTQPVLTKQAVENLRIAHRELDAKILGGIMPIISYRNACFIQSEVTGISVAEEIIEVFKDLDREQSEEMAVKISIEAARQIAPYVDGYYLMTPFMRTDIIIKIKAEIEKEVG